MQAQVPKELYDANSLYTLGGASLGVVIGCGVCAHVLEFNPRWLGLLFAETLAIGGILALPQDVNKSKVSLWVIALFNGFLIYSQAVGLNTLNHAFPSRNVKQSTLIPILDPVMWWPPANQQTLIANQQKAFLNQQRAIKDAVEKLSEASQQLQTVRLKAAEQLAQNKSENKKDELLYKELAEQFRQTQKPLLAAADAISSAPQQPGSSNGSSLRLFSTGKLVLALQSRSSIEH